MEIEIRKFPSSFPLTACSKNASKALLKNLRKMAPGWIKSQWKMFPLIYLGLMIEQLIWDYKSYKSPVHTFCCPGVVSDEPSRVALGKNVLMISSASEIPCHVKSKSSPCNILLPNQYSIQLTEFWKINWPLFTSMHFTTISPTSK